MAAKANESAVVWRTAAEQARTAGVERRATRQKVDLRRCRNGKIGPVPVINQGGGIGPQLARTRHSAYSRFQSTAGNRVCSGNVGLSLDYRHSLGPPLFAGPGADEATRHRRAGLAGAPLVAAVNQEPMLCRIACEMCIMSNASGPSGASVCALWYLGRRRGSCALLS